MKTNKLMMAMAVMAAVSTTSCTNEEDLAVNNTGNDNAVTFGAYIGSAPASRAGVTDLDALKKSRFGVFAYYTRQAEYNATGFAPNFMYNQPVEWKDGNWTYSPIKYWPNNVDDKVTFFAYGPYNNENVYGMSANDALGDPTLSFSMTQDVAKQVDLVYAEGVKDMTKPGSADKVNLNFKHALSRIGFSWTAEVDATANAQLDGATTITIKKIEFNSDDLITDGTLNLATGEWTPNSKDALTYTLDVQNVDFVNDNNVISGGKSEIPTKQLNNADKYMMIIPSESTTSTITVTYDVITTDPSLDGGNSTVTNTIEMPVALEFKAGKAYNIVLKVGLTSVKFDAKVEDWDNAENNPEVNI